MGSPRLPARLALLAVLTLGVAACSSTASDTDAGGQTIGADLPVGGSASAIPSTRAPSPTASVPSASVPSAGSSSSFVPVRSWHWSTADASGYTADYTFEIGAVSAQAALPLLPGFSATSAVTSTCTGGNPATDGYLPMRLTMSNTSAGFTHTVRASFSIEQTWQPDLQELPVVAGFSSGATCVAMAAQQPGNGQRSYSPSCADLAPGASCSTTAYVRLADYLSPAAPTGDPAVLDPITLWVQHSTTAGPVSIAAPEGPGAFPVNAVVLGLPLDGVQD